MLNLKIGGVDNISSARPIKKPSVATSPIPNILLSIWKFVSIKSIYEIVKIRKTAKNVIPP